MDSFADALIRATAADIAAHGVVDVGVGGVGLLAQQRHRGHDLSGLAVAALRHIFFHPGLLHWMASVGGQPLDGRDFFPGYARNLRDARARGFAVDVHGTRAAQSHPAAKLCAGHIQRVAQHPQERHVRADIHRLRFPV